MLVRGSLSPLALDLASVAHRDVVYHGETIDICRDAAGN